MNRQDCQKSIITSLSWLSAQVEINNKINLTDINIHAENFYRDLLNLAFGYNLENINIVDPNAAAIDLGDMSGKFAIQVTSTSTLAKTRNTVTKFIDKKLYKKYDRLVILNIKEKKKHNSQFTGDDTFKIDNKKDIWDISDLATQFNDLDLEKMQEIAEFLNKQLYLKPANSIPRNVETILQLIELISDEGHACVGNGFLDEPFPDEKINKRFSDHSEFLKHEFQQLYVEYGAVLASVEQNSDISPVKLRRAAEHLRVFSDQILTECSGNPQTALAKLIENFTHLLNNNGFQADTGAAQFFILKHLIKCNVFPNKELKNGQLV